MLRFRKKIFFGQMIGSAFLIGILFFFLDRKTVLLCFGLLSANGLIGTAIINQILRPVQQILKAIGPYTEGKEELLSPIVLNKQNGSEEFSQLAKTFNSLTGRIQKQIEYLFRQREETEEILESLGEGIIAADPSAQVTFANRTACRMLGISPNAVLKQTLDSLGGENGLLKKCHDLLVYSLQTSESLVHTWVVRGQSPLYLDLISAPLAHKDGALLVLQDKTSDYRILELGKDFIANASHELRTPITIIRGFAETLQDLPHISSAMLHEITEKIVRTCGRLDKLVRSLLTLADIENLSGEKFKPIDLIPLIENCIHTLLALNPQVQVDIQLETEPLFILGDGDLVELAFMNILENGVKYSERTPRIQIKTERVGEFVHLDIKDEGIGIPEKDLSHIFDRFYTVDKARSRKSGGAGLGLSIVKTVAEKHKGKVMVRSEIGRGSAFTFILPIHPFSR